jgi:cyclohexa-1,5-dienecarbonyl-CoA hydratase
MSLVAVERAQGVVRIVLQNPPVNVLTCRLMEELTRVLGAFEPGDRLAVIRGAGKHFSAGADVAEHLPGSGPELLETLLALFRTLDASPVPTLAVARGACLGAGLELAAACDLLAVADEAKLGVPEITLGVMAPIGAVDLPAKVGPARAADLLFSGRTISGKQAAEWGLATESAPDAELDARAEALAARIAVHSGAALRACRRAVRAAAARPGRAEALAAAIGVYREDVFPSADGEEGLKAFLEKRKPAWKDR